MTVDIERYIYGPDRQHAKIAELDAKVSDPGYRLISFGHQALDDAVALFPGSVTAIAGRPSMGKSLGCKWLAKRETARIVDDGVSAAQCVVFVTLEEDVPRVSMAVRGVTVSGAPISNADIYRQRLTPGAITAASVAAGLPPFYVIGHPGIVNDRMPPPVSASVIVRAIERITDTTKGGQHPTLILIDYIQLLSPDDGAVNERTKVAQVMAAAESAKMVATATGAAVVIAVQAGRRVDDLAFPMPEARDMQWASSIEQVCDTILGVMRPIRCPAWRPGMPNSDDYLVVGAGTGQKSYHVDDDLAVYGIAKQRAGQSSGLFPCFAPHDLATFDAAVAS